MKLFHGSEKIIERPAFGVGKRYNDYGRGFYCTEVQEMAMEWAVSETKSGFANQYELEENGLTVLDLNGDDYHGLHWMAMLLAHRTFDLDTLLASEARDYLLEHFFIKPDDYDLIRGYRADDSYFSFAQDFLNGTISYQQLMRALRLGRMGEQIMLRSERAFERIRFVGYEVADHTEYFAKRQQRDHQARRQYFDRERNRRGKDDFFVIHLLNGEVKPDDPRL
ncbi:MAG: DUF3990 domain-containing protein [Firmicutes bacterium]|nr:DUF3990 domain-containing protein [Bacillota bacterium]